jgi:hypothetical protein
MKEGLRLKRPFAIGRVATKATVCDWRRIVRALFTRTMRFVLQRILRGLKSGQPFNPEFALA